MSGQGGAFCTDNKDLYKKWMNIDNFELILEFVKSNNIDTIIVGPEGPLDKGIVDFFKMSVHADVHLFITFSCLLKILL